MRTAHINTMRNKTFKCSTISVGYNHVQPLNMSVKLLELCVNFILTQFCKEIDEKTSAFAAPTNEWHQFVELESKTFDFILV